MMRVEVPKGKYVLAVSGGVDSVVLLDVLAKRPGVGLIVAHFNHGIRIDSEKDEELVRSYAKMLGLPFEAGYGRLGTAASEAAARNARYGFLKAVQAKYGADSIITAHHQDDWIETALLNVIRGTGRKGLSSIRNNSGIIRPLLGVPKSEIIDYAKRQGLKWREDSTNQTTAYLRNHVRLKVIPGLTSRQRENLICNLEKVAKNNTEIDAIIAKLSQSILIDCRISRASYAELPNTIRFELLGYWLHRASAGEFDRLTISRLDLALKTARPGTLQPTIGNGKIEFGRDSALLKNRWGKVVNGLV